MTTVAPDNERVPREREAPASSHFFYLLHESSSAGLPLVRERAIPWMMRLQFFQERAQQLYEALNGEWSRLEYERFLNGAYAEFTGVSESCLRDDRRRLERFIRRICATCERSVELHEREALKTCRDRAPPGKDQRIVPRWSK